MKGFTPINMKITFTAATAHKHKIKKSGKNGNAVRLLTLASLSATTTENREKFSAHERHLAMAISPATIPANIPASAINDKCPEIQAPATRCPLKTKFPAKTATIPATSPATIWHPILLCTPR